MGKFCGWMVVMVTQQGGCIQWHQTVYSPSLSFIIQLEKESSHSSRQKIVWFHFIYFSWLQAAFCSKYNTPSWANRARPSSRSGVPLFHAHLWFRLPCLAPNTQLAAACQIVLWPRPSVVFTTNIYSTVSMKLLGISLGSGKTELNSAPAFKIMLLYWWKQRPGIKPRLKTAPALSALFPVSSLSVPSVTIWWVFSLLTFAPAHHEA